MTEKKTTCIDDDMVDTIGLAVGFALAVYDQTRSNGGQLDRINATSKELFNLIEDERFTESQAAVIEGVAAGLTAYIAARLRDEARAPKFGDKII